MIGPVSVDIAWLDEMQGPSLGWSLVTLKSPGVQPRVARSPHNSRNTCGSGGVPSATADHRQLQFGADQRERKRAAGSEGRELRAEEVKLIPVHDAKAAEAVVPGRDAYCAKADPGRATMPF